MRQLRCDSRTVALLGTCMSQQQQNAHHVWQSTICMSQQQETPHHAVVPLDSVYPALVQGSTAMGANVRQAVNLGLTIPEQHQLLPQHFHAHRLVLDLV